MAPGLVGHGHTDQAEQLENQDTGQRGAAAETERQRANSRPLVEPPSRQHTRRADRLLSKARQISGRHSVLSRTSAARPTIAKTDVGVALGVLVGQEVVGKTYKVRLLS